MEAIRVHRNELPCVFAGPKSKFQNAETHRVAHFTVANRKSEQVVAASAGSCDDFADAILRVGIAKWVLWGKSLVGMLVAVQYEIRMRLVQVLPELAKLRVNRVLLEDA